MFNSWSGGTKHLDFGRGGSGDKMEYVFGGALVLIIIAAVAFAIHSFGGGGKAAPVPSEFHMFCMSCKKQFTISREDLAKMQTQAPQVQPGPGNGPSAGMPPGIGPMRAQCPDCKKFSLIPERMCPNCKKYYHTNTDITGMNMMIGMPITNSAPVICPWCKVNITDYYKAHPQKPE